jgi:hypothetical protein
MPRAPIPYSPKLGRSGLVGRRSRRHLRRRWVRAVTGRHQWKEDNPLMKASLDVKPFTERRTRKADEDHSLD